MTVVRAFSDAYEVFAYGCVRVFGSCKHLGRQPSSIYLFIYLCIYLSIYLSIYLHYTTHIQFGDGESNWLVSAPFVWLKILSFGALDAEALKCSRHANLQGRRSSKTHSIKEMFLKSYTDANYSFKKHSLIKGGLEDPGSSPLIRTLHNPYIYIYVYNPYRVPISLN